MLDRARPADPDAQAGRTIRAELRFLHGGGRTFLGHQHVPYPFHVTKPHAAEPGRPDLATLILQSAAGGLYRGDRLALDIAAGAGAAAHVASQAATVVHAAAGQGIVVDTRLDAGRGAFLALTSDPYILFPGTSLTVRTDVTLDADATVILAEGFAIHDPAAAGRPFGRLATRCRIVGRDGTVLVDDAGAIDGTAFAGHGSPLGPYRAMGSVMLLGPGAMQRDIARLEAEGGGGDILAGVSPLPNAAGCCVRLLASGGGPLARALASVVAAGYAAAIGHPAAQRRW